MLPTLVPLAIYSPCNKISRLISPLFFPLNLSAPEIWKHVGNRGKEGNGARVMDFPADTSKCLTRSLKKRTTRDPRRRLRERAHSAVTARVPGFLAIEDAPRMPPSKLNVISDLMTAGTGPMNSKIALLHRRSRARILLQPSYYMETSFYNVSVFVPPLCGLGRSR